MLRRPGGAARGRRGRPRAALDHLDESDGRRRSGPTPTILATTPTALADQLAEWHDLGRRRVPAATRPPPRRPRRHRRRARPRAPAHGAGARRATPTAPSAEPTRPRAPGQPLRRRPTRRGRRDERRPHPARRSSTWRRSCPAASSAPGAAQLDRPGPRAEAAGYRRYWLAEHHFTPGSPARRRRLLIGQVAAATSTIRVGSAAVQTGHQTPLSIVEQFGILDALFPGRIDLGLGRSGQRRAEAHRRAAVGALDAGSGARERRRPERDRPRRRRAADPEAVLVRQAARLVAARAPLRAPAAAGRRDP